MSDLIKFDLIKNDKKKVQKAKRPNRLLFISILIVLLLVTAIVAFFVLIERDEEGRQEENPKPITEEQLKNNAQPRKPSKPVYKKPEEKINNQTLEENTKSVSDMILKRRGGWRQLISAISVLELPVRAITSYKDMGLLVHTKLDSTMAIDSILVDFAKDSIAYKKQFADKYEALVLVKLPKKAEIDGDESLDIVQPFHFGTIGSEVEELAEENDMEVQSRKTLGNMSYEWGKKHRFILKAKGNLDDLASLLEEIESKDKMIDIDVIAIEIFEIDSEKELSEQECTFAITFALYKVTGIVE
ncbi:MAG: hypothetical protein ACLFSQ_09230 [Candidatus Zixiibacteriota bacterium]